MEIGKECEKKDLSEQNEMKHGRELVEISRTVKKPRVDCQSPIKNMWLSHSTADGSYELNVYTAQCSVTDCNHDMTEIIGQFKHAS